MRDIPAKKTVEPWSMLELNRIVMAARTLPGFVGEIASMHWWPALVLLILDQDISAEFAVQLPRTSFNAESGRLSIGYFVYQLHVITCEAFRALPPNREFLLPWPKDSGKPPFCMLWRDFKTVLYRAGLPYTRQNSFSRLQATCQSQHDLMDHIRPILGFVCIEGKPQLIRARDLRLHALPKNADTNAAGDSKESVRPKPQRRMQGNTIIANSVTQTDDPNTLLTIFRSKYRPGKLRQASQKTIDQYERTIALFYSYAGKELTFADLTDELVDDFLSNCFERGAQAATCNKYRASLLALWRFGWKRRLTNEQPRDVAKLQVDQQLPDAWTTDELERIVAAASKLPGYVCDIPASVWWPAFILTLYDTGLRFNALMVRPTSDLNDDGWLTIDAADQKQRKAQTFKLHGDTLRFLRAMKPVDRLHLFPWPYSSKHMIRNSYRAILSAAGLPTSKRDLFHKLRRTSATAVAVASDENSARDHLGHSSLSVTRRYLDHRQITSLVASEIIARPGVGCTERK